MNPFLLSLALLTVWLSHSFRLAAQSSNVAPAQNAAILGPPSTGWARVQALSPGASLSITTGQGTLRCRFQSADPDSITCLRGKQTESRPRTEVRRISVAHRGRSLLIGVAIGGGAGAAAGAALGRNGQIVGRGGLAAIFGIPLAALGAGVGAATDFTREIVYRAP